MHLVEGEKVLYEERPDKSLVGFWFFSRSLGICLFFAFLILWGVMLFGSLYLEAQGQDVNTPPMYLLPPFFLTILPVVLVLSLLYNSALKNTFKYTITNQRCIFEGGIIIKISRTIPYHKITDISVSQNIFEGMFGISRLNIHTASTGQNKPEVTFLGLKDTQKAEKIIQENLRLFKKDIGE